MSSHPGPGTMSFRWIRLFLIGGIWLLVFILSTPIAMFILPDLETRFRPVLSNQKISMVVLSADKSYLLWRWEFDKNRRGTPEFFSFMAYSRAEPHVRMPVEVFTNWDCTVNINSAKATPVGNGFFRHMCARLPTVMQGRTDVVIDGYADYKVGHPFYSIPQRIPEDPEDWPGVSPVMTVNPPTPVVGSK